MGRARSSRRQQYARRCYFCAAVGNITKEHVWSEWLGQDVDVVPVQVTRRLGFSVTGPDEFTEDPTTVVTKPGSALTARVREICRSCNTGWMSRLETQVKPLIRRLTAEYYPFGLTTLTPDEAAAVATWAIKSSWIRELESGRKITPTKQQRDYLMKNRLPPEWTHVWAARYDGVNNFATTLSQIQTKHQDQPWATAETREVMICVLTFNGLVLLARTVDGWGVPDTPLDGSIWQPFWPVAQTVHWPPAKVAGDIHVRNATSLFSPWLQMPVANKFIRYPGGVKHIHRN